MKTRSRYKGQQSPKVRRALSLSWKLLTYILQKFYIILIFKLKILTKCKSSLQRMALFDKISKH